MYAMETGVQSAADQTALDVVAILRISMTAFEQDLRCPGRHAGNGNVAAGVNVTAHSLQWEWERYSGGRPGLYRWGRARDGALWWP